MLFHNDFCIALRVIKDSQLTGSSIESLDDIDRKSEVTRAIGLISDLCLNKDSVGAQLSLEEISFDDVLRFGSCQQLPVVIFFQISIEQCVGNDWGF